MQGILDIKADYRVCILPVESRNSTKNVMATPADGV
jgi:hypothetical protein